MIERVELCEFMVCGYLYFFIHTITTRCKRLAQTSFLIFPKVYDMFEFICAWFVVECTGTYFMKWTDVTPTFSHTPPQIWKLHPGCWPNPKVIAEKNTFGGVINTAQWSVCVSLTYVLHTWLLCLGGAMVCFSSCVRVPEISALNHLAQLIL